MVRIAVCLLFGQTKGSIFFNLDITRHYLVELNLLLDNYRQKGYKSEGFTYFSFARVSITTEPYLNSTCHEYEAFNSINSVFRFST